MQPFIHCMQPAQSQDLESFLIISLFFSLTADGDISRCASLGIWRARAYPNGAKPISITKACSPHSPKYASSHKKHVQTCMPMRIQATRSLTCPLTTVVRSRNNNTARLLLKPPPPCAIVAHGNRPHRSPCHRPPAPCPSGWRASSTVLPSAKTLLAKTVSFYISRQQHTLSLIHLPC